MPKPIFVRPARANEGQLYFDWAKESTVNEFDPEVALFPSSVSWCAYDKDGPLAFQTIQRPLVLESLAPRPGATKLQIASALKELTQNAVTQAAITGAGEILFLGSDEATSEFAVSHIFEEVPMKLYRVKVKELSCS
jgi:hypothetical protein